MTASKETPVRHIRYRAREVDYLMDDASGKEFGSALWREDMTEFESGEFTIIYQGTSSNFREAKNGIKDKK